jgi:hypothetical protein
MYRTFSEKYLGFEEPYAYSIFCKNRYDDAVNEHRGANYKKHAGQYVGPGELMTFNVRHQTARIEQPDLIAKDQKNGIDEERQADDPDIERYIYQ